MKRFFQALAVAAAIAYFSAPAGATPLAPGGATDNIPTIVESGTIVDSLQSTFKYGSGANAVNGIFREVVVATGPNGTGPLDFLYQVTVAPTTRGTGANGVVNMFTVSGFATPTTVNVNQTASAATLDTQGGFFVNPLGSGSNPIMSASRAPGTGDGVTFFAPTGAGQSSFIGIITTNDTQVALLPGTATFDGHTLVFNTYIPFVPVPEPVTMVLWGGSFAGLTVIGALRRRKALSAR